MKADAKKSSTLDKKYSEAVDGCRQLQDKFYDEEMPRILEDFQSMEETRIDRTKVALQAFIELQRGISPEILSSCDRMAVNVKNISTSAVCFLFSALPPFPPALIHSFPYPGPSILYFGKENQCT